MSKAPAPRKTRLEQLRAVLEAAGCGDLMAAILQDLRSEATPPPPPPAPVQSGPPPQKSIGRPTQLTRELGERIAQFVRDGCFPLVAAEAVGVRERSFYRWMQWGEERRHGRFFEFWQMVRQAQAEARARAEIEVFRREKLAWLSKGPGRTMPGRPGWTDTWDVKVQTHEALEVHVIYADRDPAAPAALSSTGNGDRRRTPV